MVGRWRWSYAISKNGQEVGVFLLHWTTVSKITRPLPLSSAI
jgi:hypothetical protein